MKHIFLILIFGFAGVVRAGEGFIADYVVPTPADLVEHSRFKVLIKSGYQGDDTNKIIYIFPEELTGIADGMVTLKRDNEFSDVWLGDEMDAVCTTHQKFFSCNMYLNKNQALSASGSNLKIFNKQRALEILRSKGFAEDIFNKKARVLDHFHSGEPAGILSYQYKGY